MNTGTAQLILQEPFFQPAEKNESIVHAMRHRSNERSGHDEAKLQVLCSSRDCYCWKRGAGYVCRVVRATPTLLAPEIAAAIIFFTLTIGRR